MKLAARETKSLRHINYFHTSVADPGECRTDGPGRVAARLDETVSEMYIKLVFITNIQYFTIVIIDLIFVY